MLKTANEENLRGHGFDKKTVEERRELASKAGKASVQSRRRKKEIKEYAKMIMETKVPKNAAKAVKALGLNENDATYGALIAASMVRKAMGGDIKATKMILELIGQDPHLILREKELEYQKARDSEEISIEDIDLARADVYADDDKEQDG